MDAEVSGLSLQSLSRGGGGEGGGGKWENLGDLGLSRFGVQ